MRTLIVSAIATAPLIAVACEYAATAYINAEAERLAELSTYHTVPGATSSQLGRLSSPSR